MEPKEGVEPQPAVCRLASVTLEPGDSCSWGVNTGPQRTTVVTSLGCHLAVSRPATDAHLGYRGSRVSSRYSHSMGRVWLAIVLAGMLSACGTSPSPSASPEATAVSVSGLPPGCGPIELRGPDGGVIDLTGEWAGSGRIAGDLETARLLQVGNCLYGSVSGELTTSSLPGIETTEEVLTNLTGHIGSDFGIDVELVVLSQPPWTQIAEYSALVFVIEWDEGTGQIHLREDREPGTVAQRCLGQAEWCTVPVIWYPVDQGRTP